MITDQFLTSHILYRACRHNLGENEETCRLVERQDSDQLVKEIEQRVQPFVADFLTQKNLIETFVPAVISLFLGTWSDKNGRKKIILISYCGNYTLIMLLIMM